MTRYSISVTGDELSLVIRSLRYEATNRRGLARCCDGIASLASQKTAFLSEANQLDSLATRLNLSDSLPRKIVCNAAGCIAVFDIGAETLQGAFDAALAAGWIGGGWASMFCPKCANPNRVQP